MGELLSPTLELSQRLGQRWVNIETARSLARETRDQLTEVFVDIDSDDTSIVVLGSLGREEFTPGSDIDWTLLVDGISDPNHHALSIIIGDMINTWASKPVGREGTFGTFVSSHDLIHKIGGEEDTNRNLTRRLLLLLESTRVGRPFALERVTKNILKRYLLEDQSFWRGTGGYGHHIPHFLLNDFARFWRTMAVDFAFKLRERSGKGWAIRNIKLRMSRILLFVAGLLDCFRCLVYFVPQHPRPEELFRNEEFRPAVVDFLSSIFSPPPLDIVASFLLDYPGPDGTASKLFGAYDRFLGMLSDSQTRDHLDGLPEGAGESDAVYQQARDISHHFRDALLDLFFDTKTELGQLTRLYGVF